MTVDLDKEELELEQAFEKQNIKVPYLSPEELKKEKKKLKTYKIKKQEKKWVLLRLKISDLAKLKVKANEIGIPYQTYLVSELHKLANS